WTLRLIVVAATFGVVCALALTAFLPALRGGTPGPAVLVVGALVALAAVAVGTQAFSIGMVLTRGGPERVTETLAGIQYDYAFRMARFGLGAAVAALTGVLLAALGVAATVLVAASRLRVTLTPARREQGPGAGAFPRDAASRTRSPAGTAVAVVALVLVTVVALVCAWPWIAGVLAAPGAPAGGLRAQVNTWVPALVGALVSVGVAYLAALGIGGLRPLGRHSEWLLLLFAPWLFTGTGPLSVADWQNVRDLGLVDSFLALFPPLLVSVPALLVLTLLCKGLAGRNDGDFFGRVLMPSLPMAGILVVAVTLVNAQDALWPLLVAQRPELFTVPVTQMNQLGGFLTTVPDVGASTPLIAVALVLAAVVAAQLLYLDRLAVTVGGSRTAAPGA
ncbi:MAG: sugar ABC transporter permease, partial [Nonomuraea sp.]|nr:sugar ABC transporter permease [Nonomuraea sp.]